MTRWTMLGVVLGVGVVGAALGARFDALGADLVPVLGLAMLTLGVVMLVRQGSPFIPPRVLVVRTGLVWTVLGAACLATAGFAALVLGPSPALGPAALVACMLGVTFLARGQGAIGAGGLRGGAALADPPLARTGGAASASIQRRAA